MAYTLWSVVYGEQPTAAKWNQLGANDAGFKDGTNIDAGAITTAKLATKAATEAKMDLLSISKIKTRLSGTMAVTSTSTKIPFNSTEFQDGTLLTRSGSDIVIGAGVTRVRVSFSVMLESGAGGVAYCYARIQKNAVLQSQQLNPFAGGFASASDSTVVPVTAGDTISVVLDTGGGSANLPISRNPSLTVEVVG